MMILCKYCNRIHDKYYDCEPKLKRKNTKKTNPERLYRSSNKWTDKSRDIRKRDSNLCQICLTKGIYNNKNLEVHHIVKLKNDFNKKDDDYNLITLCNKCHDEADMGEIPMKLLQEIAKRNTIEREHIDLV